MQSNGFDRKMISGDLKKNIFSNPKGGPLCFQKRKSALVGVFLEKNPMTNKIKKFLYILEHLIPDGRDEIPTFALYHPLLLKLKHSKEFFMGLLGFSIFSNQGGLSSISKFSLTLRVDAKVLLFRVFWPPQI